MRFVISLGGSVIVPDKIDVSFLGKFREIVLKKVVKGDSFIIVAGGGKTCRIYQNAAKGVGNIPPDSLDWIGISASRLNAELILRMFGKYAYDKVIHDPLKRVQTKKKMIVGAGFLPGSSTDLRAVQLASTYGIQEVINISNIDYVYDRDPNKDSSAKRIEGISWSGFQKLVGKRWAPGSHFPFDPIAAGFARKKKIKVIITGKDTKNLSYILEGKDFKGTVIGP